MQNPHPQMSQEAPHEELFRICREKAGKGVWALGQSADENGNPIWYVYCSKKRKLKKLPGFYKEQPVVGVFCKPPKVNKKK